MAGEQIPITPDIIRWARERAGYSIEDAAQTFKKIEAWEAGQAFPTYPQLEQLAEAFKLPVAVFFFPEPPELPPIQETFRTLSGAAFSQIPRNVRQLLRKAKALQLNLAELYDENPARRSIIQDLAIRDEASPEALAVRVRSYLQVSLEDQENWGTDDNALKNWRGILFGVGIFVFKDAFRASDYSGFCLFDEIFPLIYVNNSVAKTRQIFTLFHELAHLLYQTSGVDTFRDEFIRELPASARRVEIVCNQFASEFLVPDREFAAAIRGLQPTEETAEQIAARFHVSREVVFRKFLDRDLIDQATYEEAAARWAAQVRDKSGGNPYWTKITYLGRPYIQRALTLYRQNRIDERQLAEYLDWKPRYLEALEGYFEKGSE
jgi:Zn-dependent peptidase ImmA (M78 family)